MRNRYYDDPQNVAPAFHCEQCGTELYDYDHCFVCGSILLCEDCANARDDDYDWMAPAYALQQYYETIYGGDAL